MTQANTLRRGKTWTLIAAYWKTSSARSGWAFGIALLVTTIAAVRLEVLLINWNKDFFNALQAHEQTRFWSLLPVFALLAGLVVACSAAAKYLSSWLELDWRAWLTGHYADAWLSRGNFYRLNTQAPNTDNPDQRLAEDTKSFASMTIMLVLQFLSTVLTLFAFLAILWNTSISLEFTFAGHRWFIPGGMAGFALVYAITGTAVAHLIGGRLVKLNYERQRSEADYRFAATRVRENAEQVALYGGEAYEREALTARFASIARNWRQFLATNLRLNLFTTSFTQLTSVFPFVVAASYYFDGQLQLGDLMQTATAFTQVQAAMSFCLYAYPQLAEWRSVADRLIDFEDALADVSAKAPASSLSSDCVDNYRLENVAVSLPDSSALLADVTLEINPGDRILILGESGSGKTSLFRAIAGLWPVASGTLVRPHRAHSLFVPQKSYMPLGTLRDVLTYPKHGLSDADLLPLLADLGVPEWGSRLNEIAHWGQQLSLGEQQRVAIMRVLLMRPMFLFLDEATSALDESLEATVYLMLKSSLPSTAIVSIGHRSTLAAFHSDVRVVRRQTADRRCFTLSQIMGTECIS
jgi:putative ATP-binding cassette transporter